MSETLQPLWGFFVYMNKPKQIYKMKKKQLTVKKNLDDLLEEWAVMAPGTWENDNTPTLGDWYAVSNDEGIVAYFGKEEDALRFRLGEINRVLNG